VGRLGRLNVEGISGDIWRDVTVRKLTLRDEQGTWLEADNVHMTWRYLDLLRRHFHADEVDAQAIRVLRRPTLTPKGEDTGLPLSVHIAKARARVELTPEFSYERGVYDLAMNLDVERNGDQRGSVRARSVLHPGDYLNLDFDVAKKRSLEILGDAEEARGGALAGALGLPPNRPFGL
jgi:translocation and assembly module TamB